MWKVGVFTLESLFSPTVNLKKPPIVLMSKKSLGTVDLELFTMVTTQKLTFSTLFYNIPYIKNFTFLSFHLK